METEQIATADLPGTLFRVALNNMHEALAHISGKPRNKMPSGPPPRIARADELSPCRLPKARSPHRRR